MKRSQRAKAHESILLHLENQLRWSEEALRRAPDGFCRTYRRERVRLWKLAIAGIRSEESTP